MPSSRSQSRLFVPRASPEASTGSSPSKDSAGAPPLDLVGFGSMVLDRMHRTQRILGPNEKGLLDPVGDGGPVEARIGGLMLNQLGWASLFGIRAGLFGRQAEDEAGRALRGAMSSAKIETHLDLTGSASSLAEIFIDREGERAIYMAAGATAETTPEHVEKDHADFLARGRRLTTEISQLPLATTLSALRLAHAAGLATVLDFDILPSDAVPALGTSETLEAILEETDLLKPTALVAKALVPDAPSLESAARTLRERYSLQLVVMTDGERGALLSTEAGEVRVPAYAVERVNDSTGAGDAFLGGLLAGEALGFDVEQATRLGNACGAVCVERLGAFPDEPDALRGKVEDRFGDKVARSG